MRLLTTLTLLLFLTLPAFTQDAPQYPCMENPKARVFDFWLGTWEVFVKDQKVGENVITMARRRLCDP